jgi:hypothetical protein
MQRQEYGFGILTVGFGKPAGHILGCDEDDASTMASYACSSNALQVSFA